MLVGYVAGVLLLGAAGAAKLVRPDELALALDRLVPRVPRPRGSRPRLLRGSARVVAAGELVLAATAMGAPVAAGGVAIAAAYVVFTAVTARALVADPGTTCGCWTSTAPVTRLHVLLMASLAVCALAAAVTAAGSERLWRAAGGQGPAVLLLAVVLAALVHAATTSAAVLETEVGRVRAARGGLR